MEHVCRISRILSNPRGNALLVGVGGSGKQSLARLSAFICQLEIFQIMVTSSYGINDFRLDVMELYKKVGMKGATFAFIITDSQIVDRQMLVYINDMLASLHPRPIPRPPPTPTLSLGLTAPCPYP